MNKLPISLVIITLNEEANIARCIQSVPFADEVIILDSGSRDKTLEIARGFNGVRSFYEPWQGYAKQKIKATSLAKNDWVLSLDADEALSEEAVREIVELFKTSHSCDAYTLPRKNWYCGKWMRHGGMYPDYQTRLFRRSLARWTESEVHEHVVAKNNKKLKSPILHWSFKNIVHQIETINRYSSLRAVDFEKQGKKFSASKMFVKTISKFFETYILKRGFLDGVQGLMVSFVSAFATFLRWAKLYERGLENRK